METYAFDPLLSLTGDCSQSKYDEVPDPGCPSPPHPGAFANPTAVAIDLYGNEYVASWGTDGTQGRIDVFDPSGHYVTGLADPFGPKSLTIDEAGNLYVWEQVPGGVSEVVRYTPSTYNGPASEVAYSGARASIRTYPNRSAGGIALDRSTGHLFLTGESAIDEIGSASEGNKLLSTITNDHLSSQSWLALDAERDRLYASSCPDGGTNCWVLVFESHAPYDLVKEVKGTDLPAGRFLSRQGWTSIAVDEETGNFFVDDLEQTKNIYEFDQSYDYVSTITYSGFIGGAHPLQIAVSNAAGAPNHHFVFAPSHPTGGGHAFAFRPAQEQAPEVADVLADNLGETEVELRATVSPNGGATSYVFEYVDEETWEEEGFSAAQIGGSGTVAGAVEEVSVSAAVAGLSPGGSYRFRIRVSNGVGTAEEEGGFTLYADAKVSDECPNQAVRGGLSLHLPDCRAYELVTPADPNGRAPKGVGFVGSRFKTLEASPSGNAVSFFTEGGVLPGLEGSGAFNGSLYRAERGASGWTVLSNGPDGTASTVSSIGSSSPDQGHAFWTAEREGPAVIDERDTAYVRYPDGHSQLVGEGSLGTDPSALGKRITDGAAHIIFQTNSFGGLAIQLEPNAPPSGTQAVYDRTPDGVTHVVSLLPGDKTPAKGESAIYVGSSDDGAGVAFQIGPTLFLRVNDAATYEIGDELTYAGISEGGSRIFYVKSGNLFAYDVGSEESIQFTSVDNATVVNIASNGARAYFVSPTVIAGSGENPNGAVAKKGKQNLYLSEEGEIRFVATVTARDVEGEERSDGQTDGLGLWLVSVGTGQLAKDPSRTNPAGTTIVFQSRANLEGYDPSGFPQVFRYDSVENRLDCLSCIPTKAPASGGATLQSVAEVQSTPPPFSSYGFVPNLRPDGKRVVFESSEALVAADTDGVRDVYEWESAGIGSCNRPRGCVYLVSSGQSASDSYLYGASSSGDDVFFITADTLVPGDDATLSIYDARVGGGFPVAVSTPCVGEACRPGSTTPPALRQPARPAGSTKARHCHHGKRRIKRHGKVRCVKKRRHHQRRQGNRSREEIAR